MACQNCEIEKYTPLFGINTSDDFFDIRLERKFSILIPENILKLAPRTFLGVDPTHTPHPYPRPQTNTQHTAANT